MKDLVTLLTDDLLGTGLACVKRFVHQLHVHVIICDLPSACSSYIPCLSLILPTHLTQKDFGCIYVFVNCASITLSQQIFEHSFENFNRIIDVNTNGTYNMIQHMIPLMVNNEIIINMSYVAAFEGRRGQTAYATSKEAIVKMARPLAEELASMNICVCDIVPDVFDTSLLRELHVKVSNIPGDFSLFSARLGDSDEFAQVAQTIVENPLLNDINIRVDALLRMPSK
ncbi:unnamed protein product [Rotaria sordida]|uniref:Uncharacterized protein n=1 Tax=Rotaria sordida TaxID=392033 RepID=A0A813UUK2_9BILA|nr:unnamed protein product [Rotaria sordida]